MFAEMKDRADSIVWHEYETEATDSIDDPEVWARANPGIADGIKSESYMRDMAARAKGSPANEADFRAFDLNQPINPAALMICTVGEWQSCLVDKLPPPKGPCFVGLDVGGSKSMSAIVAFWPETGRTETYGAFPDTPPLYERGTQDGVGRRYERMAQEGSLWTYPGRTTPIARFLEDALGHISQRGRIVALGADKYKQSEVKDALRDASVRRSVSWRGGGMTGESSHDVIAWQRAVQKGVLKHRHSVMMESAILNSNLEYDSKGMVRLDKRKHRDRIDALSASVIAVGLATAAFRGRLPGVVTVEKIF